MEPEQELYEHRYSATLAQARQEYRMKKRGYKVEASANGSLATAAVFAALLGSAFWWQRESKRLGGRDWRGLPVIKQLLGFISSGKADRRLYAKPSGAAGAAAATASGSLEESAAAAPSSSSASSWSANRRLMTLILGQPLAP